MHALPDALMQVNGVRNRFCGFAFDRCLAFEPKKLTQTGPVAGVRSHHGDRQRATFTSPTTLLDRGCRSPCCTRLSYCQMLCLKKADQATISV